jgi:hypothetical protein
MARLKRRQFIECAFTSCTPAKVVEYRQQAESLIQTAEDESRVPVGLSAIRKLTHYPQYASIHAICIAVHLQDMNGDSYRMKLSRHKRSPRCRVHCAPHCLSAPNNERNSCTVGILPLRFFMQPTIALSSPERT